MSFLAKLELDGEEFNVLEFDITFTQGTDNNGKPANKAKGGQIRLLVESTRSDSFSDWMISQTSTKDGKVVFYRRDAMSTMKSVTFKKGYCISYHESFRSQGTTPMCTLIMITSNELSIGNTKFENSWKNS
jgi:Hemolysin coregulated protein Hcp (TssD)